MISSLLLALNFKKNFDEITNAKNYLIVVVDEKVEISDIWRIEQFLIEKTLGKVLPIYFDKESSAVSIVFDDFNNFEKLLKTLKRMLWESGILLSSKIVLVSPEMKVVKDYGQGE